MYTYQTTFSELLLSANVYMWCKHAAQIKMVIVVQDMLNNTSCQRGAMSLHTTYQSYLKMHEAQLRQMLSPPRSSVN